MSESKMLEVTVRWKGRVKFHRKGRASAVIYAFKKFMDAHPEYIVDFISEEPSVSTPKEGHCYLGDL